MVLEYIEPVVDHLDPVPLPGVPPRHRWCLHLLDGVMMFDDLHLTDGAHGHAVLDPGAVSPGHDLVLVVPCHNQCLAVVLLERFHHPTTGLAHSCQTHVYKRQFIIRSLLNQRLPPPPQVTSDNSL